MDLQLDGKRALVTGGSKGIGKAIARTLASEGVNVAIIARNMDLLKKTAYELTNENKGTVIPIKGDTGDSTSVKKFVGSSVEELGGIDILVNNAARPGGQNPIPSLENITDSEFNEDINVKVLGYLRCAREIAPYMKKNKWGRIINISGLNARLSGNTVGSIRNIAVAAMTKNLAEELGPLGINVTVVHPGITRTEATSKLITERSKDTGLTESEIERDMSQVNSVKRVIDASDIANVVTFLASPVSIAINGDAIAAGGGVGKAIHY